MKLKTIITTLCLLILASTGLGLVNYYRTAQQAALQDNHHQSLSAIIASAERLDARLQEHRHTVAKLARLGQISAALENPAPATLATANQVLLDAQSDFPGSIFYLLDRQGDTLAASNHLTPDSFVGHNYAFRPYFQDGLLDRDLVFPAIGVTPGQKGLYLSHPVRAPAGGRVIGVLAGKLPPDELKQVLWPDQFQGVIALTGPDDLVFFSNRPALENQFLWHLPAPEKLTALSQSQQFGPGPWTWAEFLKINLHQASGPDGQSYTIHRHPITAIPNWHLTYLHDNTAFAARLSTRLGRDIGLLLLTLLVLVSLFVFLLYRLAARDLQEKKGWEDQLGEQMAERTTELQAANRDLRLEMSRHQKVAEALAQSQKTKELLNRILSLALDNSSLQEFLDNFIQQAATFPDLGLLPKGALFLVDQEQPGYLQLKAHFGLDQSLITTCHRVKFGHCLCGRAAAAGKMLFANRIDERHDNTYPGITPHGHYCIPILSPDRKLLGLYNVYTQPEAVQSQEVEDFLVSVATVLSGIIRFKQTTQQISESEEQHRAITDTAQEAIISIDHQGKTSFWNPAAARIFGYTAAEVLGLDLHQLLTPKKQLPEARKGLAHFAQTGQGPLIGQTAELIGHRKDGTMVEIELSISAVHQHSRWAAVGILRDISGRLKIEKEKTQLQGQLRQAQKMEAIGTLAGGIAHDFNNILSSILGFAELVREELPQSCAASLDDLDQVIKAGNRAKDLVRQILTFSRQTEEEFVPVQISLIVKEALKLLRSSLPSAIEIQQVISDNALTVFADPSQIHQVLMNLCTNSFKAMREKGGILEVRLESFIPDRDFTETYPDLQANRYVCLVVSDTGIGMSSAIIPRIFDPYFSTNKKEDGTGLGLAVVHGIVTRLGGAIQVESTVNVGSTFKIYLPVAENLELPAELPLATFLPLGSEHILLVDDELPILELSSRMLTGLGYQVTCRTSSIEALELFRNQPANFDLVITDQNMPNMTGTRLADEMANLRPELPIILCTGYAEFNLGQHIHSNNIRKIIMKPMAKAQMAATVRQVLDGGETPEPTTPPSAQEDR